MCGIIGYIGKENATPFLLEGLRRESYRGYDSSGIVVFEKETARYVRTVGKLEKLEEAIAQDPFSGTVGLGHNRWATHGGVTQENAHPHTDCKGNFFLVHNGIIENYAILREKLEKKGHRFTSQTDTEVLPHLIEYFFKGNLEQAVREALRRVRGAYGIAVIAKQDPSKIVVAKLSSPLVLSVNGAGGFVASDPAALLSHSNKMVFLDDREIGVITPDSFSVTDLQEHLKVKETTELDWTLEEAEKGGYPHFLLKEIMEQPESLSNALRGRLLADEGMVKLGGLDLAKERLREIERVQLLACGSASYASRVGEYILEEYAGIPTEVDIASEFRYRKPVFDKKTLSIFVSQSGETADTLAALHEVKEKGGLTLGVVNVAGSSLARGVDMGVYTHAGAETAVASTKTFTAQIAALALIAVFLGRQRQLSLVMGQRIVKELARVPDLVRKTLEGAGQIQQIAEKYQQFSNFFLIGRKYNNPIALEGALKLKETAYVHAEGTGGGELKHGSLALIDESFPTVAIVPSDSVYEKMISGIQEIKARNGKVIAIATEGNEDIKKIVDDVIYIPKTLEMLTPILTTIPMQLFAYYMGVAKGNDVDKPRNLAKSVTVE
ncbi:MAG: glutamine--fructose-6-phosphate transaminase (isomerizing) [Candidatus Wildermuthbacteria bacterium]|nr:glutamine--fructose-6-phosphate transaminase (isomerizing) [Candidatus Wildermuthbacteria bacterium]